MKPADAYIEAHIHSFVQRVEDASKEDPSPHAFPNAVAQMEFLSREEWVHLKSSLDTDEDATVIAYIEKHPSYKEMVATKFGRFIPVIRLNDRMGQFCVIDPVL